MIPLHRRAAAVITFTALIIILVNIAWWFFYNRTEKSLEEQLDHRLSSVASLGATSVKPGIVNPLVDGFLSAYDTTLNILENIRMADSLAEVFVITPTFKYLASTSPDAEETYYLSALNASYIDSVFTLAWADQYNSPVVTEGYRVGNLVLKSAFAPLYDTTGLAVAVLGIEADVNYTDVLLDLRNNLFLSTAVSVGAGIIFGLFFLFIQRRINAAERQLFLSQAQANLGRMVAVVSHEIKNPLMIIRASAERLKKGGATEAEFIIEETDRLNNILTNYLDFARGKIELDISRVDLIPLLENIHRQFSSRLSQENISLKYNRPEIELIALADPTALRQVIINLILNGADAVKEYHGSDGGDVTIVPEKQDNRIIIEVIDQGKGMDKQQIKTVFEPFYTTKTAGSGLGLFLSKRLTKDMGGDIKLESEPGGPTRAAIILRAAEKE